MIISKLLTKHYQAGLFPPPEIDQLLALALHQPIEYLYKYPEKKLPLSAIRAFDRLINKRKQNYSLAYLQGYKNFYNLKFLVNKHTLIPRPDSELLVNQAIKYIKKNDHVLDIGTGSGCLIISLAKNFPQAQYYAGDISSPALTIAKTNARKNKVKIKFIKSNLLNNIPKIKFNIILANLPYLTKEQLKEPSIKKEPPTALYGGSDGLNYYDKLLSQINTYLADNFTILLEIDPQQAETIKLRIKQYLPTAKISLLKDLNQNYRLVKISN